MANGSCKDPYSTQDLLFSLQTGADVVRRVGALAGTFGAGITYTILLSASHGRLGPVSWAFTCFVLALVFSTAVPSYRGTVRLLLPHFSRYYRASVWTSSYAWYPRYCTRRDDLADLQGPPVAGSHTALRVAGWFTTSLIALVPLIGWSPYKFTSLLSLWKRFLYFLRRMLRLSGMRDTGEIG
jgi:hypothetical protein